MADEKPYTDEEEFRLARQLRAITARVYAGELSDRPLRVELLLGPPPGVLRGGCAHIPDGFGSRDAGPSS